MRLLGRDVHHLSEIDEFRLGWLLAQSGEHSRSGRTQHWKITAKSRGGVVLWIGNIHDEIDAWRFWHRLQNGALGYQDYVVPQPAYCPSIREIVGVVYEFATVVAFTATGTTSWPVPANVFATDYLIIAGGGGGGPLGGGGGAGGYLAGTLSGILPTQTKAVTIGPGGARTPANSAAGTNSASVGNNGGNSVFDALTAIGGGGGGKSGPSSTAGSGGSGGGGGKDGGIGAPGTPGQGTSGGTTPNAGSQGGSGGGGASQAGANGSGSETVGKGGDGLTSSISGTSTGYAGGASGGSNNGPTPPTSSFGAGQGDNNSTGSDGTANRGGGGGGGAWASGRFGWAGGSGLLLLSFTPTPRFQPITPMLGM